MNERLSWQRGSGPQHFVARFPEGLAEVWHIPTGPEGTEGWQFRIACGETIQSAKANSKQHGADQCNELWPEVVRKEAARRKKADELASLERQIDDGLAAGGVDVMAFGLASSTYDRLLKINELLREKKALFGPLQPLAEAVSAELYRRRAGRGP